MKDLLSNAVYTVHANNWKPVVPPTKMEQFQSKLFQVGDTMKKFVREKDMIPVIGTSMGMIVGGLVFAGFFLIWYFSLIRLGRKTRRQEYAKALGMMSRPTSDDSQYQHLRQINIKRGKKSSSFSFAFWQQLWRQTFQSFQKTGDLPVITGPACYLVWEPETNNGQLVQLYSKTPLSLTSEDQIIVAVWKPVSHILSSKYENCGRTILVGNCKVGFQGKHNYCHGICQFIKSTFPCGGGSITLLENADLPIDVYLYLNDTRKEFQTLVFRMRTPLILPGNTLAVACLPKSTPFYSGVTVDMYKWLADGERKGSSVRF